MASKTILPFHGDKEDENPEDFLRAFYRRMGDKTDEVRKAQFRHYLQADSAADEWYAELPDDEQRASLGPEKMQSPRPRPNDDILTCFEWAIAIAWHV